MELKFKESYYLLDQLIWGCGRAPSILITSCCLLFAGVGMCWRRGYIMTGLEFIGFEMIMVMNCNKWPHGFG